MKKRLLSWLLVLCMVLTLVPADILAVGGDTNPESTPAEAAEETAGTVQSGLMSEPDDGAEPYTAGEDLVDGTDGTMTRAEWLHNLAVVFEMSMDEDNLPDNYYSDLTEEHTYYKDILLAESYGMIDVEPGDPLRPDEPAEREFAAHTLNVYIGYQLEDDAYTFSDVEDVTYPNDAQVALNRGWLALESGKFLPNKAITAAEAQTMLDDAATAYAQQHPENSGENTFVFKDGVKVVPQGTAVSMLSDGTISIPDCGIEIKTNDIIAVYFLDIPAIYRVEAVQSADGITNVTGTALNLEDGVDSAEASGSTQIGLENVTPAEGAELYYIMDNGTQTKSRAAALRSAKNLKAIHGSVPIKVGEIKVTLTFDMPSPWMEYNISLNNREAFVSIDGNITATCNAKTDIFKQGGLSPKVPLAEIALPGIGSAGIYAYVKLDGSVTACFEGHMRVGVGYADGCVQVPSQFTNTKKTVTTQADMEAGIMAEIKMTMISFIDASVSAQMGIHAQFVEKTRSDGPPNKCVGLKYWLFADARYKLNLDLKITFKDLKGSYPLLDENSGLAVEVHYEDGDQVPYCTVDKNFSKYFTPCSSYNYLNGGWMGGSGKTYNDKWEPIEVYKYTTDDDGNATITGFYGNVSALAIPKTIDGHPVVAIGSNAFKNLTQIRIVTIPEGVTTIGDSAFSGCGNLTSVNFPNSLTKIESYAFSKCVSLTSLDFPKSLSLVSKLAFEECTALQRVYIPSSMGCAYSYNTVFDDAAGIFDGCSNLATVDFEEGTTQICAGMFAGSGLKHIDIPETVTHIGAYAFAFCQQLESVSLPESLVEIGERAFWYCTALNDIILPSYLTTIGKLAFCKCTSLTKINIPKNTSEGYVTYSCNTVFDDAAGIFDGCSNLTTVDFEEGTKVIHGGMFAGSGLKSIIVPDTVTYIGPYSFAFCKQLTSVTLPESLVEISDRAFWYCTALNDIILPSCLSTIGELAFCNCTSLTKINIPKNTSEGYVTYSYNTVFDDAAGIFDGCSNLTTVDFEEGTTWIHGGMFAGSGLKHIDIPETVTHIGAYAFAFCQQLESVSLPESLVEIGERTFWYCTSLKEIVIPDSVTDMGTYTFAKCSALERAVLPQGRINITEGTFSGCTNLKDVTMPDTVTYIRNYAFQNCASLEQISLSPELILIGGYAFDGCTSLKELNLPEKVTTIGSYAFRNCDSLTEMQITNPVNTLGNYCFYDCDALTSVELADSVTAFGTYCFYDCDALTGIILPDSITSIGTNSFCGCDSLKDVTLSKNLTVIPENCFKDCPSLETIVIPKGVTTIKTAAFMNDTGLTSVTIPVTVTTIESNGFSYSDRMTVCGCAGTYAETYAGDMGFQFVDVTNPIEGFELVGGAERVVIDRYQYYTPEYTILATDESTDTTDVLTYSFSNTNAKLVGKQIYGQYAGECVVTVTATSGVTYTFTVVVRATKTLAVTALPEKTSYAYGEPLDTTGLVVTANYDNGDVGEVTNYTISGYDPNTYGEQTVTVSYGGKTASFKVTVVDDRVLLSGIAVTTPPAKTVYVKGEAIDYTGIGITATYTDGSTQEIPASDCAFSGFNRLKIGVQTITVTYQGQTATFDVTVVAETHVHDYTATVTAPTCTEQGYTTYTCACGDSYVGDYVDALGHHFENGKCTVCGADDPAYNAGEGRIVVSSVRARAGEEVTLDVSIENNPGIMVMTLGIDYDKSKLEYLGYEDGILTGWTIAQNAVWLGDQDSTENGVMLKLKFRVLDDVEDGDIQVTVLYSDGDIANSQEEMLHPAIEPGKVTVYSAISGDFNGDGIINSLDLLRLKKHLAGGETEIASGDITGDGIVNSLDLLRLKKYLAGDNVTLN